MHDIDIQKALVAHLETRFATASPVITVPVRGRIDDRDYPGSDTVVVVKVTYREVLEALGVADVLFSVETPLGLVDGQSTAIDASRHRLAQTAVLAGFVQDDTLKAGLSALLTTHAGATLATGKSWRIREWREGQSEEESRRTSELDIAIGVVAVEG